ncbi:MAG TPA: hypothetical protein IAC25_00880 [Candidatus Enterenecus stercoripullorum]|nr:hypothetical protein [Candidatus Enterenecus stercoripullorum]
MKDSILDGLLAKALGQEILRCIDLTDSAALIERVNHNSITLLAQIKDILDNPALSDSECFYRIDAIVDAFHAEGLSTRRHEGAT